MRSSPWARCRVSTTFITERPPPCSEANGLVGSWSESPPRRSTVSTALAGVTVGVAALAASTNSATGTPMKNSSRPTKTPATVTRNCFIDKVSKPRWRAPYRRRSPVQSANTGRAAADALRIRPDIAGVGAGVSTTLRRAVSSARAAWSSPADGAVISSRETLHAKPYRLRPRRHSARRSFPARQPDRRDAGGDLLGPWHGRSDATRRRTAAGLDAGRRFQPAQPGQPSGFGRQSAGPGGIDSVFRRHHAQRLHEPGPHAGRRAAGWTDARRRLRPEPLVEHGRRGDFDDPVDAGASGLGFDRPRARAFAD